MFLIIILIVGIATAGVVKASTPVVRVEPKSNKADPGETFSVTITVTDIVISPLCKGLYGWEAWMTFKPKVINAVNATEGPFLKTACNETIWVPVKINNTEGTVRVGAMISPFPSFPPTGANESGVLATITFEVMSTGRTSLHFEPVKTKLYTVISDYNAPIEFTAVDGVFDNRAFVLSTELIGAIVVVVVVVCVVAVFFYRRRRAAARV